MSTRPLLLPLSGNEALASELARRRPAEVGELELSHFADGESLVCLASEVGGRDVALCSTLDDPDDKLLPLIFAADAARELGARSVTLVAPYLCYLRQDDRFRPGEAVSARSVGRMLSAALDGLVTVDPHLHRLAALSDVFTVPALALQSAPLLSEWIRREIHRPLVVGPDAESEQWAASVAAGAECPHVVLDKVRHDDLHVEISVPDVSEHLDRQPVLVDDIVSTGGTLVAAVRRLIEAGLPAPTCLAVHGLFVGEAERFIHAAGARRIVTTDSVPHVSNQIPLDQLLADGLGELLERLRRAGA